MIQVGWVSKRIYCMFYWALCWVFNR